MLQITDYQKQALKTINPHLTNEQVVTMCLLGLCGESGEVADMFKKLMFHQGKSVDQIDMKKIALELGDILWYIAVLSDRLGLGLEYLMKLNIQKLEDRHQGSFTPTYTSDSGDSEKGNTQ